MPKCPKCNSDWVRYSWTGKYHCAKCEWVFGKIPTSKSIDDVPDQFKWW